ncbi:hypothetical protein L2E82_36814 [Cichorium intybus]|uniref:Uncharacterized protein n=1 Tax=Cichorium intybus TaxID=13427 RepID=A0ACB9AE29_CICIN|nr:hypothetical protein L2E82_36814 [Cichorium intybus]
MKNRLLFPIQHRGAWLLFKECQNHGWKAEDADYSDELGEFQSELENEQRQAIRVSVASAAIDSYLFSDFSCNLFKRFEEVEKRCFLAFQLGAYLNHHEAYNNILQMIAVGEKDQNDAIREVEASDCYWGKRDCLKDDSSTISEKLVTYCWLKGILGSVLCFTLFSLKKIRDPEGRFRVLPADS